MVSHPVVNAENISLESRDSPIEVKPKDKNTRKAAESSSRAEKRQRPGKLDIAAAKDASKRDLELMISSRDQLTLGTPSKVPRNTISGVSQPSTPVTAASQSSASPALRQQAPRSIRVVQTPRAETPKLETPPRELASVIVTTPVTHLPHQVSRQASISSLYQPNTPANETISDTVSVTSNSISRPGSPFLGKVGSAPIRLNTRSQQKKERQARARRLEESRQSEESTITAALPDEQVHAPIVGRKKKMRKSKLQSSTDPASIEDGSSSPFHHDEKIQEDADSFVSAVPKEDRKVSPGAGKGSNVTNKKTTNKLVSEAVPEHPADISETSRKTQLTAASIFAELQKAGEVVSSALDLFRNVPGMNHRFSVTESDLTEVTKTPPLSNAQRRLLEQGTGVYVKTATNKYAVILPDRRVLRGFSREQAERFLDLRQQTLDTTGPAMFRSTRHGINRWMNIEGPGGIGSRAGSTEAYMTRLGDTGITSKAVMQAMADLFSVSALHGKQADFPHEAFLDASHNAEVSSSAGVQIRQTTMTVNEAELALAAARKETEALEKRLNGLLKKNRKLLTSSH